MGLTKQERQDFQELRDDVKEIRTALVGINGEGGLIRKVEAVADSHYSLRRKVYIGAAFLAGSGGITGIVLGAINGA